MPIYEYQCQECQTVFEEWQSGYEEQEMDCPECGGTSKRLISHTAFHLKGGGWYADGYGEKKSESAPGKTDQPAPKEAAAQSNCPAAKAASGSTESAPAPKKESTGTTSAGSAS